MHRKQRLDYQTVESVNVRALLLNVDVNLSEERSRVVQSQRDFEGLVVITVLLAVLVLANFNRSIHIPQQYSA